MSKDTTNSGGPDDPVMATTRAAKTLERGLLEHSRRENDGNTAGGYRLPNQSVEGGELGQKARAKKEKEATVKRLMKQALDLMRENLRDLLKQRDALLEDLKGYEKDYAAAKAKLPQTPNGEIDWAKIGEDEGIPRKDGETDAAYAKRAEKEMREKAKRGELDPNSPLAILLRAEAKINTTKIKIKHVEDKVKEYAEVLNDIATPEQKQEFVESLKAEKIDVPNALINNLDDLKDRQDFHVELHGKKDGTTFSGADEKGASGAARNEKVTSYDLDNAFLARSTKIPSPSPTQTTSAAKTVNMASDPTPEIVLSLANNFKKNAEGKENPKVTLDQTAALSDKISQDIQNVTFTEKTFT